MRHQRQRRAGAALRLALCAACAMLGAAPAPASAWPASENRPLPEWRPAQDRVLAGQRFTPRLPLRAYFSNVRDLDVGDTRRHPAGQACQATSEPCPGYLVVSDSRFQCEQRLGCCWVPQPAGTPLHVQLRPDAGTCRAKVGQRGPARNGGGAGPAPPAVPPLPPGGRATPRPAPQGGHLGCSGGSVCDVARPVCCARGYGLLDFSCISLNSLTSRPTPCRVPSVRGSHRIAILSGALTGHPLVPTPESVTGPVDHPMTTRDDHVLRADTHTAPASSSSPA